jgi:hypothetical protein
VRGLMNFGRRRLTARPRCGLARRAARPRDRRHARG